MRVVVTGGRNFADREFVWRTLDSLPISELAHGACKTGADAHADAWARKEIRRGRGSSFGALFTYKADWAMDGNAAGPKRNQRMLEAFRPDLVVAFPGGRGTADCVRKARAMLIEVRVFTPREDERS